MGTEIGFESLEVWKRGCSLAVYVYESLAQNCDFGLRDQMQRASISIPSNIAEGYERTPKDFIRMLRISLGSAAELRTQAYIARKVNVLTNEQMTHITNETKVIAKMISGLIKAREARLD